MTDGEPGRLPSRPRAILRSAWTWWVGFALLAAIGAPRIARQVRACFSPSPRISAGPSRDFDLLMGFLGTFTKTGVLYDTTGTDPYGPITTSMFKYPPPHAALVLALIPRPGRSTILDEAERTAIRDLPLEERQAARQRLLATQQLRQARPLFLFYLASFAAALGVVLAILRPGWRLAGLITLIFLNWQPHWESLEGPGIESFLLLLLVLSLAALKAGRVSAGGIPIGLAGGLKVYPWGAAFLFLFSRRGLWVLLGVLGGAVLSFAAATCFVPLPVSVGYLTHVMPRVGGASGLSDNLTALGNLSRLAYGLSGQRAPVEIPGIRELIQGSRLPTPALVALAAWLALGALLTVLTIRASRRAPPETPQRNDMLRLGLSVSLALMLMPTAWSAYQTLLLVPLATGLALAPSPGRAKLTWGLLLFAGAAGAVNLGLASGPPILLRSLIPLALWLACVRLLDPRRA